MMDVVESVKELCVEGSFMGDTVTPLSVLKNCAEPYQLMEIVCMKAQRDFCQSLEELEKDVGGKCFRVDKWDKDNDPNVYSGGVTCVLEGDVFEKAGVNVSSVCGNLSPGAMRQMCHRLPSDVDINKGLPFRAVGISSVIHPTNPFAPTMHFNFRYFQIQLTAEESNPKYVWWFGGGADLTPHYFFKEDAVHFHGVFKECCDSFSADYYTRFKKWCDEYFFITHRNEHRGIGGIFFDDLNTPTFNDCLNFVKTCAFSIPRCYVPIVRKRMNTPYNQAHKDWQLIRRGRYVEFNLVYDRGTKFGLCVPGSRIESILMSLPKHASWLYCHTPDQGTHEHATLEVLTHPIEYF